MDQTAVCIAVGAFLGVVLLLLYRAHLAKRRDESRRRTDEEVRAAVAEDRAKGLPVFQSYFDRQADKDSPAGRT